MGDPAPQTAPKSYTMTDTPTPRPMSPAAIAVMTAFTRGNPVLMVDGVYRGCAAAALRTAAVRVRDVIPDIGSARYACGVEDSAIFLEHIAAELEGCP
jgi:uncharacterized metal-binding protein